MYCPNCGKDLPHGASFCPECGSSNVGSNSGLGPRTTRWTGMDDLASRWARLGAAIVDGIVIMIVYLPIAFVFGVLDFSDWETSPSIGNQALSSLLSIALYIAVNGYFLARNGQTVGKLALGIKIVRSNREQASFGRLIGLRYLPISILGNIPFLGGLLVLVDVLLIFREEKNCLHDDIADTRVVRA